MRRIDRHWRQQRVEFFFAVFVDKAQGFGIQFVQSQHADSVLGERRTQAGVPAVILLVDELVGQLVQHIPFFGETQAVGTSLVVAVLDLLHHGGHTHFKEFVQVAGRDREELQSLQQRIALVLRLFEHTAIEREPGSIAVQEVVWIVKRDASHGERNYAIFLRLVPVDRKASDGSSRAAHRTLSIKHSMNDTQRADSK